jgi:exonuclease III
VLFIQEHHFSVTQAKAFERNWTKEHTGGLAILSAAPPNADISNYTGTGIIINARVIKTGLKVNPVTAFRDRTGRISAIEATFDGWDLTLVSVYAPADQGQRPAFLRNLHTTLPSLTTRNVIIGGDWNTVLDPSIDRVPPVAGTNSRGTAELLEFMTRSNLVDVWREIHPEGRMTTGPVRA